MKPKPERPVKRCWGISTWRACNDRGEVPPGFSVFTSVRKEVRGIAVCAPPDIVDGIVWNPLVSKLNPDQSGEVAKQCGVTAPDNRPPARCLLHLASHLFTDLERFHTNVGTDGDQEIGRIVRHRLDRLRDDPCHGATPARVHSAHVSARWMRDQDRHAIGRTYCNREAVGARHQCIALHIGNGVGDLGLGDFAHLGPMHLPLLEETIATNPEAPDKAGAVLPHCGLLIA